MPISGQLNLLPGTRGQVFCASLCVSSREWIANKRAGRKGVDPVKDARLCLVVLLTLVVLACSVGSPPTLLAQSGSDADETAPTITGWWPPGPIENTTLQTFIVNVTDAGSGVYWGGIKAGSAKVTGGILHGVILHSKRGEVEITIREMYEPGPKSVTLEVADNARNIATSTHYFELIDSAPPVFGPWYVDGVIAPDDLWIVADAATFRVRITDDIPTLGMNSVTVSLDGAPGTAVTPDEGDFYALSLKGLEDGPHSLSFTASDRSGNVGVSTLMFNVSLSGMKFLDPFPIDGLETCDRGIVPSIRIEEIAPNRVDADRIAWTMTGPEGQVTGRCTWAGFSSAYEPLSPLTDEGEYMLSVGGANLEGLSSRYPWASGTWSFLLDTTAPKRVVCAVAADADGRDPVDVAGVQYTADPTPSISVQVWDNDGGSGFDNAASPSCITVVVVGGGPGIEVPGTVSWGERPGDSAGPWAATWTAKDPPACGTYYYQVVAQDDAGNRGVITDPGFTFVVDRTPPTTDANAAVGTRNSSNLRRFTNDPRIHVTWDASTDGGSPGIGLLGYELEIRSQVGGPARDAGVLIHTAGSLLQPSGDDSEQYASETLPLSSGTPYTVWIRAVDLLGNESDWFGAPFIFDSGRPGNPGKPVVEPGQKAGGALSFGWAHATDAGAGVAQSGVGLYEFQIKAVDSPLWDVLDAAVTIDMVGDEDVDSVDPDTPLTGDCVFTLPTLLVDGNYVARVRAKDVAGNYSDWVESDPFSTPIHGTGPTVVMTSPTEATTTNLSTFTWTWIVEDDQDSPGIRGYWVKLNDEAWSWTTEPVVASSRLRHGANILRVKGVDNAGNEGASAEAHEVTLVDAVIFDVHPEPGAHAINEVSTIAFSVAGLYDGIVVVLLGSRPLEDDWRLVTVVRTPELAKLYILLDADVMQPGMLTVTVRIADVTKSCDYRVLGERKGFGFGRLRPW